MTLWAIEFDVPFWISFQLEGPQVSMDKVEVCSDCWQMNRVLAPIKSDQGSVAEGNLVVSLVRESISRAPRINIVSALPDIYGEPLTYLKVWTMPVCAAQASWVPVLLKARALMGAPHTLKVVTWTPDSPLSMTTCPSSDPAATTFAEGWYAAEISSDWVVTFQST